MRWPGLFHGITSTGGWSSRNASFAAQQSHNDPPAFGWGTGPGYGYPDPGERNREDEEAVDRDLYEAHEAELRFVVREDGKGHVPIARGG